MSLLRLGRGPTRRPSY